MVGVESWIAWLGVLVVEWMDHPLTQHSVSKLLSPVSLSW